MNPINLNLRCNEQIRISPVRLIGDNNEQLGIVPTHEAMRMARDAGLDLVEVAPNVRPPVCRIMDYGKWKYYQKKNVKKHHEQQLKEIRLRPKTDTHDLQIKVSHAIKFLKEGDKVQFSMVFRGRERSHREIAVQSLEAIITQLGELAKVERPPRMDGKAMVMIVVPNKTALDKLGGEKEGAPAAPASVADGSAPVPSATPASATPTAAPAGGGH